MRRRFLAVLLCQVLLAGTACLPVLAAPPGPADLARSIETAKSSIAEHEKSLHTYEAELRVTTANDPASIKRREEIRILKQYYVREINNLKAKIIDDYKKIQEFKATGQP